jgi:hypothetical protein
MKSMLSNSILDAIGNTPMVEVEGIYCKLEYLNPSGSIKARIAKYMVERAVQRGKVRLEAITPRVASLPTDLVRHKLLRPEQRRIWSTASQGVAEGGHLPEHDPVGYRRL